MTKPRRKKAAQRVVEANLIPVLSCMFLLIPALLLAMEVAPFSAIYVRPPLTTATSPAPPEPTKPEVHVRVSIRSESMQAEVRRTDAPGPDVETFPLRPSGHDFAALEGFAVAVKQAHPGLSRVELTAESDVTLSTVVAAMDALRGHRCSLVDAPSSDACLLWQVVVTS